MSSQDVTDHVWLATLHHYVAVSAIALYGYDYLITLPREVILVWGKKMGLGAGAYFMARLSLGVSLTLYLAVFTITSESVTVGWLYFHLRYKLLMLLRLCACTVTYKIADGFLLIAETCVQTILVLRTYAISQNSLSTLIGLSVLAIISVIPGWFEYATHTDHVSREVLLTNIMALVFDCVVIGVTVYHFGISRIKLWDVTASKSFISLLLYQGCLRFCFAIMVLVLLVVNDQALPQRYFNLFLSHGQVLQLGIICRFFLDVRAMNMALVRGVSTPSLNTPNFRSGDTLSTFRAVSTRARDAIVEELGNPGMEYGTATETSAGTPGKDAVGI
ncbi:hypothetical protein JB92DRAFT_3126227 [Gautieria morchelliformis]|nr:hypothetical protein JB92DRAFT_3126227 [Gautieria morchelliformis]